MCAILALDFLKTTVDKAFRVSSIPGIYLYVPGGIVEFPRAVFCYATGKQLGISTPWDKSEAPAFNHTLLGMADFINKLAVCANTLASSNRAVLISAPTPLKTIQKNTTH